MATLLINVVFRWRKAFKEDYVEDELEVFRHHFCTHFSRCKMLVKILCTSFMSKQVSSAIFLTVNRQKFVLLTLIHISST